MNKNCDYLLGLMATKGFVTVAQIEAARAESKPEQSMMEVLVEKNLVTHAQVLNAKAAHFGAQAVNLRETTIPPEIIQLISSELAHKYRVIPIGKTATSVIIAMEDPSDINATDMLAHTLDKQINQCVAAEDDISEALEKYYLGGNAVMGENHETKAVGSSETSERGK